jgi:hypothetical protein
MTKFPECLQIGLNESARCASLSTSNARVESIILGTQGFVLIRLLCEINESSLTPS